MRAPRAIHISFLQWRSVRGFFRVSLTCCYLLLFVVVLKELRKYPLEDLEKAIALLRGTKQHSPLDAPAVLMCFLSDERKAKGAPVSAAPLSPGLAAESPLPAVTDQFQAQALKLFNAADKDSSGTIGT